MKRIRPFTAALTLLAALLPALALAAATDISREELKSRLAKAEPTVIVDVRSPEEFAAGHVAGAINIPHDQVVTRAGELAAHKSDGNVVLYCRSGRRTALAVEALEARGYTGLKHLIGDMQGWEAAGEPLAR
jgi:rhodanese-related sulfurtransferase